MNITYFRHIVKTPFPLLSSIYLNVITHISYLFVIGRHTYNKHRSINTCLTESLINQHFNLFKLIFSS
ncbi:DUF1882 domain-containing protein [Chitinophaga pinensis]|uniref:DUF1882 domain-containing protein n=1 Tax=Chitinophaga pinensis TaxID=79329 RepID=A0A5C6LSN5_9BACT|nr:DUF1882 domain-containing protein [Chitinophaga pinensis]